MTPTRKYVENYLDIFEKLSCIKDDLSTLKELRSDMLTLITKIKDFDLFHLEQYQLLENTLKADKPSDFEELRDITCQRVYMSLGKILYDFENRNFDVDYGLAMEIYRTNLSFGKLVKWKYMDRYEEYFGSGLSFLSMQRNWIEITEFKIFEKYKSDIRKQNKSLRHPGDNILLNENFLAKCQNHFQNLFGKYVKFINENYHSIRHEFSHFDANVRIYIIDKSNGAKFSTKQLNVYKEIQPFNKCIVFPYYVDFFERLSNIEEIDKKSVYTSLSIFEPDDINAYRHDFSREQIYFELLDIFLRNASSQELKDFLIYLLRCQSKRVRTGEDQKEDIYIDEKRCKLLLTKTPNVKVLNGLFLEGQFSSIAFLNTPDNETLEYLKSKSIDEYYSIIQLARKHINNSNGEVIHWYIKSRLEHLQIKLPKQENISKSLIERLKRCPSGLNGWMEYENICVEIFQFLFNDNFRNLSYRVQSYTHDKIFRRDMIINNNYKDIASIWGRVKSDFDCNIIVIDFKNYSEPLTQNEFYLPSKYLNITTGRFGIVFSRKGLGNSALTLQKRMLHHEKQLLLVLKDEDIIGMLNDKNLNIDPSYRIENLMFALYEDI